VYVCVCVRVCVCTSRVLSVKAGWFEAVGVGAEHVRRSV